MGILKTVIAAIMMTTLHQPAVSSSRQAALYEDDADLHPARYRAAVNAEPCSRKRPADDGGIMPMHDGSVESDDDNLDYSLAEAERDLKDIKIN